VVGERNQHRRRRLHTQENRNEPHHPADAQYRPAHAGHASEPAVVNGGRRGVGASACRSRGSAADRDARRRSRRRLRQRRRPALVG
jgi:hypothetical protein